MSDSGDSDFHSDDNGMFFFCLHSLATVYNPMFSHSKYFPHQKTMFKIVCFSPVLWS